MLWVDTARATLHACTGWGAHDDRRDAALHVLHGASVCVLASHINVCRCDGSTNHAMVIVGWVHMKVHTYGHSLAGQHRKQATCLCCRSSSTLTNLPRKTHNLRALTEHLCSYNKVSSGGYWIVKVGLLGRHVSPAPAPGCSCRACTFAYDCTSTRRYIHTQLHLDLFLPPLPNHHALFPVDPLQNSWGPAWGEGGYARIRMTLGKGMCRMYSKVYRVDL